MKLHNIWHRQLNLYLTLIDLHVFVTSRNQPTSLGKQLSFFTPSLSGVSFSFFAKCHLGQEQMTTVFATYQPTNFVFKQNQLTQNWLKTYRQTLTSWRWNLEDDLFTKKRWHVDNLNQQTFINSKQNQHNLTNIDGLRLNNWHRQLLTCDNWHKNEDLNKP